MMTSEDSAKLGIAIIPWWLNNQHALRSWVMMQRDPAAIRRGDIALHAADECKNVPLRDHHVTVYAVKHTDPAKWEWLTREAYCLRALEILCDTLCRPLRLESRGREWRVICSGQHGQADVLGKSTTHTLSTTALEEACTQALGQLDPLWRR